MNPITIPNISIPTIGIPTIGIPSVGFPSASGGGGLSWPAGMKEHIKAWYDPKKQGMTNYDVIGAYTEDFKKWDNSPEKYTGSLTSNSLAFTNVLQATALIYSSTKPYDFKVLITGLQEGQHIKFGFDYGETILEADKNGVYTIEWKEGLRSYGIYTNFVGDCNITITQLPTSILKDLSGNGNHAYLYGGKGKLNSGMGLYKVDFTSWRKSSVQTEVKPDVVKVTPNTSNYLFIQYANSVEIPSYKIKVIGLGDNVLKYQYATENGRKEINIVEGENELPTSIKVSNDYQIGYRLTPGTSVFTITQIPDYPDQLCYDGKMYAVCYGFPILTDYTVMAERTWFEIGDNSCFASKRIGANKGAFAIEYRKLYAENFGSYNVITFVANKKEIIVQSKEKYNDKDLIAGNEIDTNQLLIGGISLNNNRLNEPYIGCHGTIIVADRSFTEEEINWLKQNWDKI
jgi:hypothetical protein